MRAPEDVDHIPDNQGEGDDEPCQSEGGRGMGPAAWARGPGSGGICLCEGF